MLIIELILHLLLKYLYVLLSLTLHLIDGAQLLSDVVLGMFDQELNLALECVDLLQLHHRYLEQLEYSQSLNWHSLGTVR